MSALPRKREIEYPTSDGQPMAETQNHVLVMLDLIFGLKLRYAAAPDVWVSGNFFLYYEEGNPKACVVPDVLVAKRVVKWDRPNYLLWEERPPSLVVEVTSLKTRRKDQRKKSLYEQIGVQELVFFDLYGEYLIPRLQGYRLVKGNYRPIPRKADGSLLSRTTGLWMKPEGDGLRLVDAETKAPILWTEERWAPNKAVVARQAAEAKISEDVAARRAAEARAAEETAALREIEERIRALEKELGRLRNERSSSLSLLPTAEEYQP
ncbi:MAG: Uma2 family endonuclease [Acidobacteria bacterium]|nr:Uma2 family endonuclease [Acidobacteriota bacterium]